uniref:chitinase n=1 Tax=Mycena chlorophos TaxID=658473 RepID=A0ABQ0M3E7_MYCCL|nr:endo-beta-N-acetylglucosaminidase [Mycena chlorophos]
MSGHHVATYYQTIYDNGVYVSPLPLLGFITHVFLAAWHIDSDFSIHLNDNPPTDPMFTQMWTELGEMQDQGVKVLGMLGGAAPGTYSALESNFTGYYEPLRDYIAEFKLDGMDLDVEQDTSLALVEQLITQLKSDFGDDFLITLAPVASALTEGANLSGFDYVSLEDAMGDQIAWYNAQFYSGFGTLDPDTGYINIINYLGIDPSRLVAGVLTNSANGGGFISINDVVDSVHQLTAMYPTFGGVNGWEYFNSLPNANEPWEFAQTMQAAMATNSKRSASRIEAREETVHAN